MARPARCWFSTPAPAFAGSEHKSDRIPAASTSCSPISTWTTFRDWVFLVRSTIPEIDVHIWGPASSTLSLGARLSRYLSPPLFPVHLRDLPRVTCHHVPRPPFDIGPFRIQTALVCHPGPTVGYRIEANSGAAAYLPDHEPALALRDGRWLEPDWTSGYDLAAGADLLIHDAQYTDRSTNIASDGGTAPTATLSSSRRGSGRRNSSLSTTIRPMTTRRWIACSKMPSGNSSRRMAFPRATRAPSSRWGQSASLELLPGARKGWGDYRPQLLPTGRYFALTE